MRIKRLIATILIFSLLCQINMTSVNGKMLNKDETSAVLNAGFENRYFSGIKNWNNGSGNTNSNYIRTGSASAKVSGYNTMTSDDIAVKAGAIYTIGAYVKTFSETEAVFVEIIEKYADNRENTTQRIPYLYGNTNEWYKLQGVIQIHDGVCDINISIVNKTGSDIYVDDVFMTRNTASLTSEQLNSDFEIVSTEDANEYPSGWRIEQTGYYDTNMSLYETPIFETDMEYYHSGKKSLHFKKSGNNATTSIINTNCFEIIDGFTAVSWGMWYRSKNSNSIIKINLNIYDENNNLIQTLPGNQILLSRSEEMSQWNCVTTTDDIPKNSKFASYEIVCTEGETDVYIDDIFFEYTQTYYEKIVEWNNFSSISDDGKIGDFDVDRNIVTENTEKNSGNGNVVTENTEKNNDSGNISINNELIIEKGSAKKKVYTMKPGYTYEVTFNYMAEEGSNFVLTFFDVENNVVENNDIVLDTTYEKIEFDKKITVPDKALYGIITYKAKNTLKVSELLIYEVASETTDESWSGNWLWYPENPSVDALWQYRFFRIYFAAQNKTVKSAYIQMAADDSIQLAPYINENWLSGTTYSDGDKKNVKVYEISGDKIVPGQNIITVPVINVNSDAGLIFEGEILYEDGTTDRIISGLTSETYVSKLGCTEPLNNETYIDFIKNYDINKQNGMWRKNNYNMDTSGFKWEKAVNFGGAKGKVSYCYDYADRITMNLELISNYEKNAEAGSTVTIKTKVTEINGLKNESRLVGRICSLSDNSFMNGKTLATIFVNVRKIDDSYVEFSFDIPDYLPVGRIELRILEKYAGLNDSSGGNTKKRENNRLAYLRLTNNNSDECIADVKKENGKLNLYINDKKMSPILYLRTHIESYYDYNILSEMKNSGIELYSTYSGFLNGFDYQYVEGKPMVWKGMDKNGNPILDYDLFDYEIYRTLDLNQDARIMVQINIDAPEWWKEQNPDELIMHHNGDYIWDENARQVSMASEKYNTDVQKVIKLLSEHMKEASYTSKIFSVKVTQGRTFEWMTYGVASGVLTDYSKCAKDSFRKFLKKKYSDETALKKAWGMEDVSFENAQIPTALERSNSKYISLVDVDTQRNVIDYNEFLGQIQSDMLIDCAKTIKNVNSNWLVGSYHGYTWSFVASEAIGSAHTAIDDVLNSEYIDFVASPVNYSERIFGYSTVAMSMTDSIAAHRKLYFIEQDNRTIYGEIFNDATEDNAVGLTNTLDDSVKQLTRDLSFNLVRGNGFWLYDMQTGWFNNKSIYSRINSIKSEYEQDKDTTSNSQVAVFVGNKNYDYATSDIVNGNQSSTHYIFNYLYKEQRRELAALGTSYDTYSIEDLCNGYVTRDYKVNIILSPFEITESQRNAIDEKLKRDNKTILWIYLPGLSDADTYLAENISSLVDMNVKFNNTQYSLNANIVDLITGSKDGIGQRYGNTTNVTGPWTYIEDNSARVIAKYDDGKCAAAYVEKVGRNNSKYISVYSAVPNVSAEILRDVCKNAGVHLYSEDKSDVIETSKDYIAIHSVKGGKKNIALPKNITSDDKNEIKIYDVFSKKNIAVKNNQFSFEMEDNDTKLFRLVIKTKSDEEATKENESITTTKGNDTDSTTERVTTNNGQGENPPQSTKKDVTTKKSDFSQTTEKNNFSTANKTQITKNSIEKKKVKIKKAVWSKKCISLSWKKLSAKINGYQIQYSDSKKFKKKKTINIKSKKSTKYIIKKVKKKKKYYVRIRAYIKVNGKKYYSSWSSKKSVKIK